jgi:hypothetical protein
VGGNKMRFLTKRNTAIGLVLLVVIISGFFTIHKQQNSSQINDSGGDPVSGLVDPNDALLNVSTIDDFINIKNRLMDYLKDQGAAVSLKVIISEVNPPDFDSSVLKFKIEVPELKQKDIVVEIDYAATPEPTISIPSKNFKTALTGEEL